MTAASDHARNAAVLDDAADYIETHGWYQGALYGPNREACALGAIRAVSPERVGAFAWGERLAALNAVVGNDIPVWNDAETTTKQIVLDTMRLAAKAERTLADAIDANDPSP